MSSKEKRAYNLLHFSESIAKVYKSSCKKNDSQFINLVKNWETIIGKEYSKILTPVKISPTKSCLFISSNRNFSTESNYIAPMILDKINTFYGYTACKKIDFIFSKKYNFNKKTISYKIKDETTEKIQKSICNIKNNDLKQSLEQLGKSMAERGKIK